MLSFFDDIEMSEITIGGEIFPLYCDHHVLNRIQIMGYEIAEFERALIGIRETVDEDGKTSYTYGSPDIGVVLSALELMLVEGMSVYNMLHPDGHLYQDPVADAHQLTFLYRGQPADLAALLHKEFVRCFDDGKKKDHPQMKTKTARTRRKSSTSTS